MHLKSKHYYSMLTGMTFEKSKWDEKSLIKLIGWHCLAGSVLSRICREYVCNCLWITGNVKEKRNSMWCVFREWNDGKINKEFIEVACDSIISVQLASNWVEWTLLARNRSFHLFYINLFSSWWDIQLFMHLSQNSFFSWNRVGLPTSLFVLRNRIASWVSSFNILLVLDLSCPPYFMSITINYLPSISTEHPR